MVEKWLLQVEKQMIKSLRDTIEKAISGYYATELTSWVLDWPGQVNNILRQHATATAKMKMKYLRLFYFNVSFQAVVCCRSINWTTEASEAIR